MSRSSGGANVAATPGVALVQLGEHDGDWDIQSAGTSPQTLTLDTQATGSTLLVFTIAELTIYGTPTDNKGNTLTLLDSSGYHGGLWALYGLEIYSKSNFTGGSSHAVSLTKSPATDESTMVVVEVKGGTIQDTSIATRAAAGGGASYTSDSVITTGPALLVASWAGDGTVWSEVAVENGWTIIEQYIETADDFAQLAVAVKAVSAAGTYTCTWTPVANQGSILFLAAVQA